MPISRRYTPYLTYLSSNERPGHTARKGYDFWVLSMLEDLGLIDSGKRRSNKSASFTEKGEEVDRRLAESISVDEPVGELFKSLEALEEEKAPDNAE